MANPGKIEVEHFQCMSDVNAFGVCVLRLSHHHSDAIFLQRRFVIGDITDPDNCGGAVTLQVLRGKRWQRENLTDRVDMHMVIYASFEKMHLYFVPL